MINIKRFYYIFFLSTLLLPLIILIVYFLNFINMRVLLSWLIGWGIVFIGFVFELLLFKRGLYKGSKSFIRNILGAITIRIFSTLILVYICLHFLELNQNNFIFSIFFFYIIYLINEIFYLNFRSS
jgi:hypothetical protein